MRQHGYLITVPPAYTGVTFLLSWIYLMFYASTAGIEAAAPISLYSATYGVSAGCMTIASIVLAFAPINRAAFLTSAKTKLAVGILLPISTTMLLVASFYESMALVIVGGVITGIASAILALQWVFAYSRVGLHVATNSFPILMAMAVGICITLMYLPQHVVLAATIACPAISEFMFHEVRKDPWPVFEVEEAYGKDKPINFVLMLLPLAVYAFSAGFLDYSSADNSYTYVFYALGSVIPLAIAGVNLFKTERDHFLPAFVVPASFLCAVCIPFLSVSQLAPLAPFISIGELGIEVLIFVVCVGFAQFFSLDPLKTYTLGRVVNVIFNAIGWYTAAYAGQAFGQVLHAQMSLVIIFVSVEVLAVFLIIAIVKAQKSIVLDEGATPHKAGSDNELLEHDEVLEQDGSNVTEEMTPALATTEASQEDALPDASDSLSIDASTSAPGVSDDSLDQNGAVTEGADSPDDNLRLVAEHIAKEHGLSQREVDVFMLLARGYTSSRIQKELYIAAGTVNYHTRNIYAKLGVHSKQELIELFEGTKAERR